MAKLEHTYWITKQNVLSRMGKKEDECVVSSDAELDAKLELFRSIQESCLDLHKILDRYQERLCCLAQEENSLGRFLKEAGSADGISAGRVLSTTGRALSYSGKQRMGLRTPVSRLTQEVDTFRIRAIADTLSDLKAMEKHRIEYRAALNWMKDISQELDPERHLDKFRKVQAQVRRSKARFDQLKLVCLQKVDLLAAARCNMYSHALVLYHQSLVEFAEKTSHAFKVVANSIKDAKSFDFCVLKELSDTTSQKEIGNDNSDKENKDDIFLFFDPTYRDDENDLQTNPSKDLKTSNDGPQDDITTINSPLLDLSAEDAAWTKQWEEVFESSVTELATNLEESPLNVSRDPMQQFGCLPSNLLDQAFANATSSNSTADASFNLKKITAALPNRLTESAMKKDDKNAWFNLFADLDPLTDPDAIGEKKVSAGRQC